MFLFYQGCIDFLLLSYHEWTCSALSDRQTCEECHPLSADESRLCCRACCCCDIDRMSLACADEWEGGWTTLEFGNFGISLT